MASSTIVKLACALVMGMVVVAPLAEAAITCGTVTSGVAPCLPYLTGGAGPSPACCAGIKSLNSAAATPADRKTACNCLKSTAANIRGMNYAAAGKLPGQCGVNVGYPISQSTDCNAVH